MRCSAIAIGFKKAEARRQKAEGRRQKWGVFHTAANRYRVTILLLEGSRIASTLSCWLPFSS